MALQIPKDGRKALAELLRAPPAFLDAFYNALKECEPRLFTRDTSQLRAKLKAFETVDAKAITAYLRLINGTLTASDENPPEKIVADLFAAAEATGERDLASTVAGWNNVKTFLTKAFALDTVRISARAFSLFFDVPRHMHDVRILTDARPVFVNRVEDGPSAFVIIHTMRLDYYEEGTTGDWYLSLDSNDLRNLKKSVDRAIEKQNSLQKLLKKTDAVVFTSAEENE